MTNTKAIIILFRAFFLKGRNDFGIHQAITFGSLSILLFTPLDHWVHNKLFEKSKLKDQATN